MRNNYGLKNEVIKKNGKREGIGKYYLGVNVSCEIPFLYFTIYLKNVIVKKIYV